MLESEQDYARFQIKPEEEPSRSGTMPAPAVVAKALEELTSAWAIRRSVFLAWFRNLTERARSASRCPLRWKSPCGRCPEASFVIVPPPLRCKVQTAADLPASVREQLGGRAGRLRHSHRRGPATPGALRADDALRALSSLVEDQPGDTAIARGVASAAMAWGLGEQPIICSAGRRRQGLRPDHLLRHGPLPGRDRPWRPGDGLL